jgi:acetolactate synthase-1/2/3 large subunit
MKIRLADYLAEFIHDQLAIRKIYTLTGGGAMFLNDCVAKHPNLDGVYNHHEQACAMASVGDAKYTNGFAVSFLTTGCGATNAITGLLDAWQDNVKCFFISGQVKRKETSSNCATELRQFGIQEANIISIVKSITKYAVMINDPNDIAYHLEKAKFLAETGRPGPVWIDIPLDVQGATIETNELKHFDYNLENHSINKSESQIEKITQFEDLLKKSTRPIILAGNGIRLGNSIDKFREFIQKYQIPVVSSYLAIDLIDNNNPLYVGNVGIKGDRAGNFALQNSDLVIAIGNRLSVGVTGFEYKLFAREAKLVVVDIDPQEHQKNTVNIDLFINEDAKKFLENIIKNNLSIEVSKSWQDKVLHWKKKWSTAITKYPSNKNNINKYTFIQHLNRHLKHDSVMVSDAGSAYYVTSQCLNISNNQRYITSGAQADMGFAIPASIGVYFAKKSEVITITGDGSFQLNIQELQTIKHYNLPIKIFVFNNNGYLSIRATQRKFFEARFAGVDSVSGVSFPDLKKIAKAYGIKFFRASKVDDLDDVLKQVLEFNNPVICEIKCPNDQEIIPNVSSQKKSDGTMISKPLEDMYPFLTREEFYKEMIIKPIEE